MANRAYTACLDVRLRMESIERRVYIDTMQWSGRKGAAESSSPSRSTGSTRTIRDDLKRCAESPLGSGNLRLAVRLPEGEIVEEWIASNTIDFVNQINMLYGTLTDYCTPTSCPVMSAGERYEYHWPVDPFQKNCREVSKVSAPAYVDQLMEWVQKYLDDENVFPTKIGNPFPSDFLHIVRIMFKRLFRVYAHIYHSHYRTILYDLNAEAHLNTSFRHFVVFVREFQLLDSLDLLPLKELIDSLVPPKDRSERDR